MIHVWDPQNLIPNLRTLGELVYRPAKSKLSKPNAQGRYSIDEDRILTRLGRTLTRGESILTDEYFLDAITQLFDHATTAWYSDTVLPGNQKIKHLDLENALKGLEKLKETYSDNVARRSKMDAILSQARQKMYQRSHPRLEPFRDRQLVAYEQWSFVPGDNGGVCKALCVDWIRRRLIPGKKSAKVKTSLPERSNGEVLSTQRLVEHMRQSVDKRIGKVQGDIEDCEKHGQNLPDMLSHYNRYSNHRHHGRYAGMNAEMLFHSPKNLITGQNPQEAEGEAFFTALRGHILETQIVRQGKSYLLPTSRCFVVDLAGASGKYHAVAIHVDPNTITFMEPNIGEYRFNRPLEEDRFVAFGKAYWSECAFFGNNVFRTYNLILIG